MVTKINKILANINEDIINYDGENLYKDGLLDSFQVIELVEQLEETFGIEIAPELVIMENFANKDTILKLTARILEEKNAG